MSICISPRSNCSDSSREACHDSDVRSWKPPADRLLVTGIPKRPAPTMTSSATAMMRRGAAMASRAIPCNTFVAPPQPAERRISADLSADNSLLNIEDHTPQTNNRGRVDRRLRGRSSCAECRGNQFLAVVGRVHDVALSLWSGSWSWPRLSRSHRYERLTRVTRILLGSSFFGPSPRAAASVAWPSRRSGFSAGSCRWYPTASRWWIVVITCPVVVSVDSTSPRWQEARYRSRVVRYSNRQRKPRSRPSGGPSPPRPRRPEPDVLSPCVDWPKVSGHERLSPN